MSGSNRDEWDNYVNGKAAENKWNFSYVNNSVEKPPQMEHSTSQMILSGPVNKPANKSLSASNKNGNNTKRNALPPTPRSVPIYRGGKRKTRRHKSRGKSKTHKKKQQH